MLGHYERRAELEHGYRRDNIDSERTHLNYNLCPRDDPLTFVRERIGELDLKRAPRKDAVRMVDTVVSLPRDYTGDVRAFMVAVKETLDEIFGAENCVGAYVHMDEATPHMHYASVPVTNDGRLSAKSLLNRTFMKQFHGRLEDGVCKRLGVERVGLVLTDDERQQRAGKYVGLKEFKDAKVATDVAQKNARESERALANLQTDVQRTQQLRAQLDDEVASESASAQQLRAEVANLKTQRDELSQQNISLLRANDDLKNANAKLLRANDDLKNANAKLLRANDALKEKVSAQQNELDAQQARITLLERAQRDLQNDIRRLQTIAQNVKRDALNLIHEVKEIADNLHLRPFLGDWKNALENLANMKGNTIAREAGQAAGGWSHQWSERDARKGDKVIEKSVRDVSALADELVEQQESLESDLDRYGSQSFDGYGLDDESLER